MLANPDPVFSCHWYVKEVPVAATVNVAFEPEHIVWSDGEVPTEGAVLIFKVAVPEFALGVHVPLTTHL